MDRSLLRRYAASGVLIAGLYLLNRFPLVPLTGWRLPAWHGADFLAGGLMLCFLNGLLLLPAGGRWSGFSPPPSSSWGAVCFGR